MTTLLRLSEVSMRLGLKRTAIYDRIAGGTLPEPIKLSPQVAVWPDGEIDACIRALIRGADDAEMKRVVINLEVARKSA